MRIKEVKYNLNTNKNITKINLIHISDIHFCTNYKLKRLDMIIETIRKSKHDYICITGDLMDTYLDGDNVENVRTFINWFSELAALCPVIVIIGNHDINIHSEKNNNRKWHKPNSLFLNRLRMLDNVHFLENAFYYDKNICFMGYIPPNSYYAGAEANFELLYNDFKNYYKNIISTNYNILLMHSPIGIIEGKLFDYLNNVDLILCGHTHGGLMPMWIPGNWGIITPFKRMFPKNVRGIIYKNNTTILINSGIMKLSRSAGWLNKFNDIYPMDLFEINLSSKNKQ